MSTPTEIKLQTQLAGINPSIDFTDAIVRDTVIVFPAAVIDDVNARINAIQAKFSNSALTSMTESDLNRFAYQTRGLVRLPGFYAAGYVYVMAPSPGGDVSIPAGTTFSTSDGAWQFYSTDALYVRAENLSAFYNSVQGAYEFRIPVQAANSGADYNVAAYRISKVRSPLSFAVRVENREGFTQGKDPESTSDFITRIGLDTAGFSVNSSEAVKNAILSQVSGVTDCVFYKQHPDANRVMVYYIGQKVSSGVLEGNTGNNPSSIIFFPKNQTPVRFVEAAVLDGIALDTQDYAYDASKMAFSSSMVLQPNLNYTVSFQYNGLGNDILSFLSSTADVHQTEWVPQEAKAIEVAVRVGVKMPSFTPLGDVEDYIVKAVVEAINLGKFVDTLSGPVLAKSIQADTTNILACTITLNEGAYLTFEPGSYPVTSSDLITVVDL
jgi:hypothetical protein